jgi:hypothetical protein
MPRIALILIALGATSVAAQQSSADDATARHFEEFIRPLFIDRCLKCHSGNDPKGGLRLDSAAGLAKGGETGPVIVPGKPDESLLIQAVRHENGLEMPPKQKLPDDQIGALAAWIKDGAIWPASTATLKAPEEDVRTRALKHWAFVPVQPVEQPPGNPDWSAHPIDRFVAEKWREHGLQPVAPADRRTLLRRVYFDLIGLPPTPEEADAFLKDDSPDAFAKFVDRLLDSPRYGERWGRHWLDVARYADTAGDNADYPVPEARLYRDYVIDTFNSDKPYDQFVREQLAGDIFAKDGPRDRYAEQVIATTFLGLTRRYATAPYELWHLSLEDSIDTVGQAFMGLTLRCARCHDHKFDPVTMRDYYALYGIFESTRYPWAGAEEFASKQFPRRHFIPLEFDDEARPKLDAYQARLNELTTQIAAEEKDGDLAKKLAALQVKVTEITASIEELKNQNQKASTLNGELAAVTKERDEVDKQLKDRINALKIEKRNLERPGAPADLPCAYGVTDGEVKSTAMQMRGEPARPGPVVPRGAIECLMDSLPLAVPENESGRRQLADWLTRPEHPLTARVMVNRIWQHHFGRGLVASPSNFGLRGALPTHPELLDWLANEFVKSGWSIKAMHRLILSSKTWQLASAGDDANLAKDPGNEFLWRHDRLRLEAEPIRDSLLSVSGMLDLNRPGDHPFPPIKDWGWTQHNQFKAVYASNHRSVYLMTQRLQRHPYLALFDGPDPNTTTEKRTSATVPLQALYVMNSPEVRAAAEGFAKRLLDAHGSDFERINLAHRFAYARLATTDEFQRGATFLTSYQTRLKDTDNSNADPNLTAWTSYAQILLAANEFVYVD